MPNARLAIAFACVFVMQQPVLAQEPASDSAPDADRFVAELLAAWNSRDVDRILTYYAADAVYEDVPNVENGWDEPWRGEDMIREALVGMFQGMPDLSFELVSASTTGSSLAVEWIMTGTHEGDFTGLPATGRTISIRGVSISKLAGSEIVSQRDYYDMYLFLSQLGVAPSLGAE